MAGALSDYASARGYFEQSLLIFRAIGDRTTEASTLAGLGRVAFEEQDDIGAMQRYYEQSLQLLQTTGELHNAIWPLSSFGWAMQCLGDYPAARAYYELALANRVNSLHYFVSFVLNNMGALARKQDSFAEAQSWYNQGLESARAASDQEAEGIALWGLGNVALDSGELASAVEAYQAAIVVFEMSGRPARVIEAVAGLVAVALAHGDLAQAQAHVETILEYLGHTTLTTNSTEEPFRVELICYQVLYALGDSRATAVLESAHERLQQQAARIFDPALQRSFLENVPHHREIVAAWAEAAGSSQ